MASPQRASAGGRIFAVIGGLLFAASLLYFLLRSREFGIPAGAWHSRGLTPAAIDVLLFTVFALHHSVFARTGFKAVVSSKVSEPLERSVYVWLSTLLFVFTLWAWMPVPGVLWHVEGAGVWVFGAGKLAGVILTGLAASAIDPLDLAGVRQAFGWPRPSGGLTTTGAYGLVRHPIYLGWLLLVWSAPVMTGTRLVFAVVSTFYLVVAVPFEERQMQRTMGQPYDDYARTVRWRMLPGIY